MLQDKCRRGMHIPVRLLGEESSAVAEKAPPARPKRNPGVVNSISYVRAAQAMHLRGEGRTAGCARQGRASADAARTRAPAPEIPTELLRMATQAREQEAKRPRT